jgi:hypothetical protein
MRRLLIFVVCAAVIGMASASADASALSLLSPYTVNVLEDNDWESALLAPPMGDGDFLLEKGEKLVGMLYVQEVRDALSTAKRTATTETFVALFALEVVDVQKSGGWFNYTFGAIDKNDWDTLTDNTGQNLGLVDPTVDGVVGRLYSDSSDPFVDETASDSEADSLATARDGDLLWEIGFRGDAGEFWYARTDSDDVRAVSVLQTRISLNVVNYVDASIQLLKHNYLWDGVVDAINPAGWNVYSDIHGYGNLSSIGSGVWQLSTDTDFYIVPTPEPGSLALLGLGLAACGGVVYRRRKNKA